MEESGRSASDNNVTPSDVPPYRVLKPRTAASLGKGRQSVEVVRTGGDSAKLAAELLGLGERRLYNLSGEWRISMRF